MGLYVDLNCDMGEGFGRYGCGPDAEVMPYISSANIACGFHASDPATMAATVRLAAQNHTAAGAHPGFPDLVGFGRRVMEVTPAEAKAMVQYQAGALWAFCQANGVRMEHVKLHGALYNMAGKDEALAAAIAEGICEIDPGLILLGLSGSAMLAAAAKTGLASAKEVFADRAYEEDGSLVKRGKPGAMITSEEEAIRRVIRMIRNGSVQAVTGKEIPMEAESICIHGDSGKALAFAKKIRASLEAEGIQVLPLRECLRAKL